jgi:hypothetical protein
MEVVVIESAKITSDDEVKSKDKLKLSLKSYCVTMSSECKILEDIKYKLSQDSKKTFVELTESLSAFLFLHTNKNLTLKFGSIDKNHICSLMQDPGNIDLVEFANNLQIIVDLSSGSIKKIRLEFIPI